MNKHLLVGIDVGCHSHQVAIAQSNGRFLKEVRVSHTANYFLSLFLEMKFYDSTNGLGQVLILNKVTWVLTQVNFIHEKKLKILTQ